MVTYTPLHITKLLFNLFFTKLKYIYFPIDGIKLGTVTTETKE
jgi:hypothetical protein